MRTRHTQLDRELHELIAERQRQSEAIARHRPPRLVFDIGPLKTPLRAPLTALRNSAVPFSSVHPMFGPATELLSGLHVIHVDSGRPDAVADVQRLIACMLCLSRAVDIALFKALAESGESYLAGTMVEGREAPPRTALSYVPGPWTEGEFHDYLRCRRGRRRGVAAGPVAPVVAGLATLHDSDVCAIAHYLAPSKPLISELQAATAIEPGRNTRPWTRLGRSPSGRPVFLANLRAPLRLAVSESAGHGTVQALVSSAALSCAFPIRHFNKRKRSLGTQIGSP